MRRKSVSPMSKLARWFGQGLLIFVPGVGTIYSVWLVLSWIDSAVGAPFPGFGVVLIGSLILLTGFLHANVVGEALVSRFESGLKRLPLVSIIYSSLKDLLGAFVGDKKSFDRPAMVSIDASGVMKVFGFVTCDRFDDVRLADHVAVYLPQAYNFAGNVVVVPRDRVQYVDADPAQFMAFIVSGGVSEMSGARTMLDMTTSDGKTLVSRPPSTPG